MKCIKPYNPRAGESAIKTAEDLGVGRSMAGDWKKNLNAKKKVELCSRWAIKF